MGRRREGDRVTESQRQQARAGQGHRQGGRRRDRETDRRQEGGTDWEREGDSEKERERWNFVKGEEIERNGQRGKYLKKKKKTSRKHYFKKKKVQNLFVDLIVKDISRYCYEVHIVFISPFPPVCGTFVLHPQLRPLPHWSPRQRPALQPGGGNFHQHQPIRAGEHGSTGEGTVSHGESPEGSEFMSLQIGVSMCLSVALHEVLAPLRVIR